jgi:hypothetical protein
MEEGEGEVESFDFSEPALVCGSAAAAQKVVFDLVEAGQHLRVNGEHGATQTRMLMLARGPVGACAASQFDFALVEVLLETEPFGFGDRPVLVRRPGLAAPVEKALVVPDHVLVEYGDVTTSRLKIQMSE